MSAAKPATYVVLTPTGPKPAGILCLVCHKLSYNPGDVENRYCENCQEFHDGRAERLVADALGEIKVLEKMAE